MTWSVMSPALTGDSARSAISAIAPSSIDNRLVWVGTEDGTIQLTRDAGTTWTRSNPPGTAEWWRISSIEPSHFDTNTAYASVVATPFDDDRPYIFRTRDAGVTWRPITTGLPERATAHAVREDAFRRGLLFAATAQSVFVSFDDGERWQSLRLNLPPAPITDLTIKDADLVVSTDGRGFWVFDDISPLRQITGDLAKASAFLFRPANAWRTPPMQATDPAAHRDEPAATNPPDGVAISYLVGSPAGDGPVTIDIIETLSGDLIRRYPGNATPGFHRVVWDTQVHAGRRTHDLGDARHLSSPIDGGVTDRAAGGDRANGSARTGLGDGSHGAVQALTRTLRATAASCRRAGAAAGHGGGSRTERGTAARGCRSGSGARSSPAGRLPSDGGNGRRRRGRDGKRRRRAGRRVTR